MALTLEEILESGLLELYVLGKLSKEEIKVVESAMEKHPEVKKEIIEIENALYKYDTLFNVQPPKDVLEKITDNLEGFDSNRNTNSYAGWNWSLILNAVLLLSLMTGILFYLQKMASLNETIEEQNIVIQECDEENSNFANQLLIREAILDNDSKKLFVSPSDNYQSTELVIYNNTVTKKNYLQIINLPSIANDQSFQLWSLKGNDSPIPLDVFEENEENIFEIQYVEATNAYAITIEPKGGKETPTLANLIGVFNVES